MNPTFKYTAAARNTISSPALAGLSSERWEMKIHKQRRSRDRNENIYETEHRKKGNFNVHDIRDHFPLSLSSHFCLLAFAFDDQKRKRREWDQKYQFLKSFDATIWNLVQLQHFTFYMTGQENKAYMRASFSYCSHAIFPPSYALTSVDFSAWCMWSF